MGPHSLRVHGVEFSKSDLDVHVLAIVNPAMAASVRGARAINDAERAARITPGYRAKKKATSVAPNKVTREELRSWFEGYSKTRQTFHVEAVRSDAAAHFGRPVTRQPVRDVIGEFEKTENRGKPKGKS